MTIDGPVELVFNRADFTAQDENSKFAQQRAKLWRHRYDMACADNAILQADIKDLEDEVALLEKENSELKTVIAEMETP